MLFGIQKHYQTLPQRPPKLSKKSSPGISVFFPGFSAFFPGISVFFGMCFLGVFFKKKHVFV